LNRQCLYETEAIGQFKVNVAADRIRQLNPEVNVLIRQTRVTQLIEILNLLDEFQPDILVLAADRPTVAIDRWTSEACFKRKIPYISGGVSGAVGRIWSKVPGRTGCFTCDELHSKELTPDLYEVARYRETYDIIPATSALSCGAQIVAGFMGYDILHSLLNRPMASAGQIISIDFATLGVNCTQRPPHPACPICGQGNHRLEGN
jgi:molybdopterin/thiamine biosynthesis adenylyltransferase